VGEFADAVQERLRERLAERRPSFDWRTEYRVGPTPVDVAGVDGDAAGDCDAAASASTDAGTLALVELEWRRADPADNSAKLFRHLADGALDEYDRIVVCQVFTGYYDLARGGVSWKRENAEFVGRVAAEAFGRDSYAPVKFDLDPPKRGGEWSADWKDRADECARRIDELLDE